MRVIDYHMHTHFSGDSEANPREHVLQAIKMNLDEIEKFLKEFEDKRSTDYRKLLCAYDLKKYCLV